MKLYLCVFLLFALIPSNNFQRMQGPTSLIDYPGKRVKQALFPNSEKTLLLIDDKAMTYDTQGMQPQSGWGISSYNINNFSLMRTLLNGNFAMICSLTLFALFDVNGVKITEYNDSTYCESALSSLCSFTEISKNYFLIAYSGTTASYLLKSFRYNESTKALSSVDEGALAKYNLKIVCNALTLPQLFICIYCHNSPDAKLLTRLLTNDLDISGSELMVSDREGVLNYELLQLNEKEVIVVFLLVSDVYARILTYENGEIEMSPEKMISSKTPVEKYFFQAISLARLENDMFIAVMNSMSYVFIQKFYNNLDLNGDLMVFLVINPVEKYVIFNSLSVLNSNYFSVILTTKIEKYYLPNFPFPNTNWQIVFSFPTCNSMRYSIPTDTILTLSLLGESSEQMILFTKELPPTQNGQVPSTPQIIEDVELFWDKGGVFKYTYVIVEQVKTAERTARIYSEDCTLSVNVCFDLCVKCHSYGRLTDHQCITCINGYYPNPQHKTDCIWGCDPDKYYYYHDINTNVDVCLPGKSCLYPDYPTLVEGTNECIQGCDTNYVWDKEERKCRCISPLVVNKITLQCVAYVDFVNDINDRINNKLDDNMLKLYENYPMWNQSNSSFSVYENTPGGKDKVANDKLSSIDYDDCEQALRLAYQIPDDEPLLIAKFDVNDEKQLTNKVSYTVYRMSGVKLDTSICNLSVEITTPIINPEDSYFDLSRDYSAHNINLFNASDSFFNDICTVDPIADKDMTLENRRLLCNNGSLLCNDDCRLLSLNLTSNKAVCSCNIKQTRAPIKWQQLVLANVIPYSNVELAKCYHLVFRVTSLYQNAGSLINICVIIIELALTIAFISSKVSSLKIYLSRIHNEAIKYQSQIRKKNKKKRINLTPFEENHFVSSIRNNTSSHSLNSSNKFSDEQLTGMPYLEALLHDKRNYFSLFCYYLHLFFFFYYTITHHAFSRVKLIQVSLLFFCIASDFFFNALLYTDNYVSKESFFLHLQRAIYASLASYCLKLLMQLLSSIPSEVARLTSRVTNPTYILFVSKKILNAYVVKVNLYLIIQFILLCCYWYYSTAFCFVYSHSQVNWVVTTLMSFVLNVLIAAILALFVALLRLLSLTWKSEAVFNVINVAKYVN